MTNGNLEIDEIKDILTLDIAIDLLRLPDHLRQTVIAMIKLDKYAIASEIADTTKKERATESCHLNILVMLGWIKKKTIDRNVVYYISKSNIVPLLYKKKSAKVEDPKKLELTTKVVM